MRNREIRYMELGKYLYFRPFDVPEHAYEYPWYIIGIIEIKDGFAYITPVYGNVILQIELSTYSFITSGESLYTLFNSSSNIKLVKDEVKMTFPQFANASSFKQEYIDNVHNFVKPLDIAFKYSIEGLNYAMVHVGNGTYSVFTYEKKECSF